MPRVRVQQMHVIHMEIATRGQIQIYTGNGKGKTTAGLGLALRARAAGKRVALVFFDKGGNHYSERAILGQLGVDWFGYGCDRIDPTTNRFRFGVLPDDVAQAEQGIAKALELVRARAHDLLILDEVNTTVALRMLTEASVERVMDEKADELELVCTGRTAVSKPVSHVVSADAGDVPARIEGQWLSYFDRADLITEMQLIEHYFYHGVPAREGIDY